MAFTSIHEIGKARELISNIESVIGFDKKTGLIKAARSVDDPDAGHLDTFENISLAINYILLGNDERGKEILASVEKYIGKDPKTGLFFNKLGIGEHEEKKVLPGEETVYVSNQVLILILLLLLKETDKAQSFFNLIKNTFQKFSFKDYQIYQHAIGLSSFYAFNNLFMAIAEWMIGDKKESTRLANDVLDLCWDKDIGLLASAPGERLYFVLDNSLLSWWHKLRKEDKQCNNIIKTIEDKIGKDPETNLFFRGIKVTTNTSEPLPPSLTYVNSVLAIGYLVSAGLFPR